MNWSSTTGRCPCGCQRTWAAGSNVSLAVPVFRRAQRLLGSTRPNFCHFSSCSSKLWIAGTARGVTLFSVRRPLARPTPWEPPLPLSTIALQRQRTSPASKAKFSASRPSQQFIAKLPFARERLCRVHSPFFADLGIGEPPASSFSLVTSRRPTPRSRACHSQVSQHMWCCRQSAHVPVGLRRSARSTC